MVLQLKTNTPKLDISGLGTQIDRESFTIVRKILVSGRVWAHIPHFSTSHIFSRFQSSHIKYGLLGMFTNLNMTLNKKNNRKNSVRIRHNPEAGTVTSLHVCGVFLTLQFR